MPWKPYGLGSIYNGLVSWKVIFFRDFDPEYEGLPTAVQDELLAQLKVVERFGPDAGRPRVDTLRGSKHANMKELRFDAADGVWRFAFAFDPNRRAAVLVGGDKSGISEKRFYRQLISKADKRFDTHLIEVEKKTGRRNR
jgi:hypothetical protein